MTSIESLLRYVPSLHGEHGVDATLHMLVRNQEHLHEVLCNPPDASWGRLEITRPRTDEIYLWDHVPRVPPAKRPDSVIEFVEDIDIHFLLTESKQHIGDIYPKMGILLKQFFTGAVGYVGILDRPAWHRRHQQSEEWEVLPPEADDVRYWLKRYPRSLIHFWTAFAFALEPEHSANESRSIDAETLAEMEAIVKRAGLDAVIAVRWFGVQHTPRVFSVYSPEFRKSRFSSRLDGLLEPAEVQ
jgi:hypothetical protein